MDIKDTVFNAARDGQLLQLKEILVDKSREEISSLVSVRDDGTAPLVIACRNGHLDVALYLVESCNADIEQVGSVTIFNGKTEYAPPLWFAADAGHLNIVKMLVKHNASVNRAKEKNNSTPLFAACKNGRFEIAKYLIQHGADIEIARKYGYTCLTVTCALGDFEITKYLLECGADINRKDERGNTALHDCARRGRIDILKMLLQGGAKSQCNANGKTPLQMAAVCGHSQVVECLMQEFSCTKQEKVNDLELLGSVHMIYTSDVANAFECWKLALELRYEDGKSPLEKPSTRSPIATCFDTIEVRTLHQLEELVSDSDEMRIQALLVVERILGPVHEDIYSYITNAGKRYHENGNLHRSVRLWMYALDVQLQVQESINYFSLEPLICSVRLFSSVMLERFPSEKDLTPVLFQDILHVFERNLMTIEKYLYIPATQKDELCKRIFHETLITALHLVGMMCRLQPHLNVHEIAEFKQASYKLVSLNPKGKNGFTPLHLACCRESSYLLYYNSVIEFPSSEVVDLLLEVGSCPNAVDTVKNTPLHIAAMNMPCSPEVFKALVNHGAHLCNSERKTPFELNEIMYILYENPKRYINLQCLSAKAIRKHEIAYEGYVPKKLTKFLDSH